MTELSYRNEYRDQPCEAEKTARALAIMKAHGCPECALYYFRCRERVSDIATVELGPALQLKPLSKRDLELTAPRMIEVGQAAVFKLHWNRLPVFESGQSQRVEVKIFGEERTSKIMPVGDVIFTLTFSMLDYYEAAGRLVGDGFQTRLLRPDEMTAEETMQTSEIFVDVRIFLVEPHPTEPNGWKQVKTIGHLRRSIRLSCHECV